MKRLYLVLILSLLIALSAFAKEFIIGGGYSAPQIGSGGGGYALLLQTDDYLLLETGSDNLLLE